MSTPRSIRLLQAPDLQTLHGAIAYALAGGTDPMAARHCVVIVPTRGAAEALRRTLEGRLAAAAGSTLVLPDIVTRAELYQHLHRHLPGAPPLLSEFEREVLLRRAARLASTAGAPAPFRLRAGLIVEILSLYDELRRRGRSVEEFERVMIARLEPSADSDRGAERMLRQTRFLTAVFRELERRVADTGRIDEHGLRARLLGPDGGSPYRHLIVGVADQAADGRGLWPADYDLLARLAGVERIDILATAGVLGAGLHQRMHQLFPRLEDVTLAAASDTPVLMAPEVRSGQPAPPWFVSRDREEELANVARRVKVAPISERSAVVFQRPLPYLYLARSVFADAGIPYQALDARPLAGEPVAAALDLVFEVATSEATRASLVELLASPQWAFAAVGPEGGLNGPTDNVHPDQLNALDGLLRELKYLGGWERLEALAAESAAPQSRHVGRLRQRAEPALQAAAAAAHEIRAVIDAGTASAQVGLLIAFVKDHERLPEPDDPDRRSHQRARGAILGALTALAEAHAAHDDDPLLMTELANSVRRWIEGQTFSPRTGAGGLRLLDAQAAPYADVDEIRLVGLVDSDWPDRSRRSIFYPASLLAELGWPAEHDRLTAARARFHDLLRLPRVRVSVSTVTLEEDAIVPPSAFLEEVEGCSLAVAREDGAALPRVFVQEALREEPLVAAAESARQADWIALRAARSSGADAAFHGAAGPRPPAAHAVSHVERYLDCPFKYFSSYVLGLDEERNEDAGLSPRERGQFLHEVFQQFFLAWEQAGHRSITPETLPAALALFEQVVDLSLAPLSEADRALERTYLLGSAVASGLAARAFGFEIEQEVGVVERLLEHVLEGEFALASADGPVRIHIRGKADRIDLLDDGTLRVVDYKLGRAPKAARALQLPVYGVCASQLLEGRHGRSWPLSRAGYLAFREKNAFSPLCSKPADLPKAVEEGQQRMVDAVSAIERGSFPVDPDEPFFCTRCGYASVCRKDYVGDE